jgi:hypothetical protein
MRMAGKATLSEKQPSPEDKVEIHIVFDYVIQRTPTRSQRQLRTRQEDFNVNLKLSRKNLDERGYPDPRALWFAERMFLKSYNDKHSPDVRLLQWKAHLKGDSFVLSEYRVLLSTSID